jgi:hypothetical protein
MTEREGRRAAFPKETAVKRRAIGIIVSLAVCVAPLTADAQPPRNFHGSAISSWRRLSGTGRGPTVGGRRSTRLSGSASSRSHPPGEPTSPRGERLDVQLSQPSPVRGGRYRNCVHSVRGGAGRGVTAAARAASADAGEHRERRSRCSVNDAGSLHSAGTARASRAGCRLLSAPDLGLVSRVPAPVAERLGHARRLPGPCGGEEGHLG